MFCDKQEFIQSLDGSKMVCLELGCGNRKRVEGAIGIDQLDYPCVDIVGDVRAILSNFPDQSVDAIYSFHFLEHVSDFSGLLKEMERILKTGGKLEAVVPHFSNPYYYSDPTHKTAFGLYTLDYFCADTKFVRKVPVYGRPLGFDVQRVDLVFKAARPFYFRYTVKRIFGLIFNSCNYMRELYEDVFCYLIPCYEIKYQLIRKNDSK